ncbi:MAG: amidohydrolase [bacterium]|nr:amidohydrolase [bacterium]
MALTAGCGKKAEPKQPADLVLKNGAFVTLDEAKPSAEALAVRQGRIVATGTNKEMEEYISESTKTIDLKGKLAIPGFIEAHGHFTGLGMAKMRLNLMPVKNWDEVIEMVAEAVKNAKPGEWIQGRGWHQEKWDRSPEPNVDGLPFHETLSKVSPDNPVLLRHASGHSSFANAKAMELAGIDEKTGNPEGGEIVKDSEGNPIGVFRETAQGLLRKAFDDQMAKQTEEEKAAELRKAIELADRASLENGVTTFHDAGTSYRVVDVFKELVRENKLGVRLYVMLNESNENLKARILDYKIMGLGDNHLTVRSIKRVIDGALGSHGAWLLEPYTSMPTSTGLNTDPVDSMKETARIAMVNGFQLNTHAIGDRGNREVLDIYEETFKKFPDAMNLRWRVEHAQHLHLEDIPRFGKLKVIASMQGIHCTSDAPWVIKRLGEKRAEEGAYVWQKLMNSDAMICNGTDVPVEDVSPISCYYATVSRKTKDGSVFYGKQRMTREQALRSYTINGAYAAFEEKLKGSLTPGKLADITVLSKDIMTIPEDEIPTTEVLYTIVGGKVAYQK